jgi:hypothetical protein
VETSHGERGVYIQQNPEKDKRKVGEMENVLLR